MLDTTHYKSVLEKARIQLESELDELGTRDNTQESNWDVKVSTLDISEADLNEVADRTEELHIDSIVLDELEIRYKNVVRALKKIEDGTYGICEVSNQPIEEDRLNANPAARTCKAHLTEEDSLPL